MKDSEKDTVEALFALPVTGEIFRLRKTLDGRPVCPVCYLEWPQGAEPAWEATGETTEGGVPIASPSWGICPRCNTEFGLDDDQPGEETLEGTWKSLRQRWLESRSTG